MLQAALRASATRGVARPPLAFQAARGFASKKKKSTIPKPPPPPAQASSQQAQASSQQAQAKPGAAPEPGQPASAPTPGEEPAPAFTSQSVPSLDFAPGEGEEEMQRERTGARSSKDSLSSIERRRRFLGRVSFAMVLLGAGAGAWYAGREWEDDELQARHMSREQATHNRWERMRARFTGVFDTFTEPLWPELLPPPLQGHMHRDYTLLVSIDDLLVASTWDRQHGWRTAKRPGVDYFLAYLSQFYEVVIFTTQQYYTALPVVEKLDPYQFFIMHKLFRDACRSENGQPVKDLKYLNRDLSKVILLDTHREHVTPNPENAVIVPKWAGDPKDRGLVAMIPFLESIAIFKTQDVRPILEAYDGKNIPIEWAKKEAEMKRKHVEEWEHSRKGLSRGGMTLSSLFGSSDPASGSQAPPTYLEQKRLEAQHQYLEEQEYLKKNKAYFDQLIKEEQEAAARQMPSTFWGAAQAMMGPPPAADGAPPTQQGAGAPGAAASSAVVAAAPAGQPAKAP
ncbi:NIF-domain-containing protein [Epithele typhae]|uniref:NIF-domain-containing protein n=1 Tax=Epithele typhae TaxID=378194 RepID=UPI002008E9CD|nr:NIF-domain-containing protein [Epithele typhae]KAH9935110.1 NIF-domain-containing protein [Epithele typhae]